MFPQAIAVLRQSVGLPGNYFTPMSTADLGHVYAISGSERDARTMLSELHGLSRKHYVSAFDIAMIHAGLGDKAQALAWLDKAYDDRSFFLVSLNVDPRFDLLRTEPRSVLWCSASGCQRNRFKAPDVGAAAAASESIRDRHRSREGIEDGDAGRLVVRYVAGDHGETVHERRRGDLLVQRILRM
jgi:hypothetical protein